LGFILSEALRKSALVRFESADGLLGLVEEVE